MPYGTQVDDDDDVIMADVDEEQHEEPPPVDTSAATTSASAVLLSSFLPSPPQPASNIIRVYGFSDTDCGYCKGQRAALVHKRQDASSHVYTVVTERMQAAVYEAFLQRGWRRSGLVLYKPDNWHSCCPALTIRLPVQDFVPTKSQKKILRRMNALLHPTESADVSHDNSSSSNSISKNKNKQPDVTTPPRLYQQYLVDSGALEQLQQTTAEVLDQVLLQHFLSHDEKSSAAIAMKPSFKVLPSSSNSKTRKESSSSSSSYLSTLSVSSSRVSLTLMSTICAAIAGKSKGRIDRATLTQLLVKALRPKLVLVAATNTEEEEQQSGEKQNVSNAAAAAVVADSSASDGTGAAPAAQSKRHRVDDQATSNKEQQQQQLATLAVVVSNVQGHEASGQIFVLVTVPATSTATTTTNHVQIAESSVSSKESSTAASAALFHHNGTSTSLRSDRLAKWWMEQQQQQQRQESAAEQQLLRQQQRLYNMASPPPPPYQLTITTIPAHVSALDPSVHELFWKYQHEIHGDADPLQDNSNDDDDDDDNSGNNHQDRQWGALAPPGWVEQAKTMLRNCYQHLPASRQKRLTRSFVAFYEFLVENPFAVSGTHRDDDETSNTSKTNHASNAGRQRRLGTYHQHYRLAHGPLIAVGVVDILPRGFSSVYLYYNPSFAHDLVPLGKYAILREIEWTQQQAQLPYYYLGYYIESCPKMRYKADYHPSELLCPTTYQWVDAEQAKATIQRDSPMRHCCTLASRPAAAAAADAATGGGTRDEDGDNVTASAVEDSFLSQIPMNIGHGHSIRFNMLTAGGQTYVRPILTDFVNAAGSLLAPHCTINLA